MSIIERAIDAARAKATLKLAEASKLPAGPVAAKVPVAPDPARTVSFTRLANQGELITETANRGIFEQFRRLKRPILQAAFGPLAGKGMEIILVTSPLPNAGKTFVSGNLAYVLAREKDRRVLLIDMDNAHRSFSRALGLDDCPGFFDVINDPALSVDEVTYATEMPGLCVLPTGRPAPDCLERLNSARCREIIARIMTDDPTRILILDAPPLLVTNEGPAMLALAGQILLVVEAGVSTKSSITKSLKLLDPDKPIGLILNKTPGNPGESLYYPAYPAAPPA
jgi:Mrp family chromosome partitioning ATPase